MCSGRVNEPEGSKYAFGHGLSGTSFAYAALKLSGSAAAGKLAVAASRRGGEERPGEGEVGRGCRGRGFDKLSRAFISLPFLQRLLRLVLVNQFE